MTDRTPEITPQDKPQNAATFAASACSATFERILKLCEAYDNQDIEGQDPEDVMEAADLVVHQICEIAAVAHAALSHHGKPTRHELEIQIKAIADECRFTMPLWLAGLLEGECRRQGLSNFQLNGDDFRLTLKVKQSPKKRLGAAGAQMQGHARDVASQQSLSQNDELRDRHANNQ